jgi:hypothetical protein
MVNGLRVTSPTQKNNAAALREHDKQCYHSLFTIVMIFTASKDPVHNQSMNHIPNAKPALNASCCILPKPPQPPAAHASEACQHAVQQGNLPRFSQPNPLL